jgi:CMP-N-acetylneuraminic acid synthetase
MKNLEHIAIIPARKNSKGIKYKNRLLFNNTANFIKKLKFINKIIVSSDDQTILEKARINNFIIHKRKKKFSEDNTSIKKTLLNILQEISIHKNSIVWLFYLPITKRIKNDFLKAKKIISNKNFKSFCTFIESDYKYHPCYSWSLKKGKLHQFIKNDFYRRQDLPEFFYHFHYISCFRVRELPKLNSELINKDTIPYKLSQRHSKVIFEVDTKKDLKTFLKN